MAFATNIHAGNVSIKDRATALYKAASEKYAQHRVYRRTLNELSALSSRELSDLGLNHSMIKRIAYEAAYGA